MATGLSNALTHRPAAGASSSCSEGRKWLKVLEMARLGVHTLKAAEANKFRPHVESASRKFEKRIRSRRARFKRLKLN